MANTTPSTAAGTESVLGKTVINDAVVAKVAGIAAREVPGVYALGGGAAGPSARSATRSTRPTSARASASKSARSRSPRT